MFELPGCSIDAAKIVAPINERLQAAASQFGSVSARRAELVSGASTLNPAGFHKACETCDRDELSALQGELAALAAAEVALPTCVEYFQATVTAAEVALSKASRLADGQLRKAGISPESQPGYAANPAAAGQRFCMMIRDAEPVRATQTALDAASSDLQVFNRMVTDLPETISSKQAALARWAHSRIFR